MNYRLTGCLLALVLSSPLWAAEQVPAVKKASVVDELKQRGQQAERLAMREPPVSRRASSNMKAVIDLSEQQMRVYVDGDHEYTWPVSTARAGYVTPNGTYKAQWLARMHYSIKYDDAPMPYSVFFHEGYAIHGTDSISRLGRPASHGCVRLHPDNAKTLFELVQQVGKSNSTIQIVGDPPVGKVPASYRMGDGRMNHRPLYEDDRSIPPSQRRRQGVAEADACPGCNRASNFGTLPNFH